MLSVVTIGKKHESWVQDGLERYQKRLRAPWNVQWILLPHSSLEGQAARQEESERILGRLNSSQYVILLDETGDMLASPQLSVQLEQRFTSGKKIAFVIGGAYGVSPALRARADAVWSLSPLVFPHQLVRLILIEQLYRAQEIARGGEYHHN